MSKQSNVIHFIVIFLLASLSGAVTAAGKTVQGETITIASPDKAVIKDLPLLSYRGLALSGSHQFSPDAKQFSPQQLAKFRIDSARIYANLMRMKLATTPPNTARLKENFKGGGSQGLKMNSGNAGAVIEDRAWYKLIADLASASMTTEAYTNYMCKDDPCSRNDLKAQNNGFTSSWGGLTSNQFESRRAFASFIDTELDKYLAWAEQLDAEPEIYFVGQTQLSPYIFDKGGFAVRINRLGGGVLPTTRDNVQALPIFSAMVDRHPGVLVKINETEAERIVERVHRKQIYYIYKAKLTVADQSYNEQTKQLDFNRLSFDQIITSDVIEVFVGPELKDKLFDIPL